MERDYDKTLNTGLWLEYKKMDREFVSPLKCKVRKQFVDNIKSGRNFNWAFMNGSKNHCASTTNDHGKTNMHQMAIHLHNKYHQKDVTDVSNANDITDYAPIAKALCTLDKISHSKFKVTQ